MKTSRLWLGAVAMLVASCDVSQPPIGCPVQSLIWVATYHPVGTHECGNKTGEQTILRVTFDDAGNVSAIDRKGMEQVARISLPDTRPTRG